MSQQVDPKGSFHPSLLSNVYGLETYMKPDLAPVDSLSKRPIRHPTKLNPYFGKWRICWICATFPTYALLSSAFSIVALTLKAIGLKHYAAHLSVYSQQMVRPWTQLADQWSEQGVMLVPAFNCPKIGASDVYACKNVPCSSITDPTIQEWTHPRVLSRVRAEQSLKRFYRDLQEVRSKQGYFSSFIRSVGNCFFGKRCNARAFQEACLSGPEKAAALLKAAVPYDPQIPIARFYRHLVQNLESVKGYNTVALNEVAHGADRGASHWFIHLLFQSRHLFETDAEGQLIAVGKQFETGIPGQALVLQALADTARLLRHKTTPMKGHTVSSYELDCDREAALQKIKDLPEGIYRARAFLHSFVYVKLKDGGCYLWDPDFGLYRKDAKQLLDFVLKYHYQKRHPDCHIYFDRHQPLDR